MSQQKIEQPDKSISRSDLKSLLIWCVSRIVAFFVKNIDTKIFFECLVGWNDSSTVEILKN